ncbi:LysR family transcriptional regulator [Dyella caseinilytica]|uniref:LysR family transcriptional regulator n=1 Tax=Dyella caseinilytica TaxID=1849581 RepID=A0ABX7GWI3_9GAMM|nr:LysR family transcriptional regulator [Dyella caseinilytica]QRN54821.1 LysR family transcriptional regulator [Dyella caseinilytica]GFZ97132.1 transcriptional regulator [Dyella caseinilytica]
MHRTEAMHIFVRVAEMASFTRAADSLGLPKASASTAIQQLEAQLGTQLLHRTTRRVQMTQDGQRFYERCKELLADMDELTSMFQQAPQMISGRLRVDMNGSIARRIMPYLPQFLREHPQLQVELSCTDRRVDVVGEGFDCVLRVGNLEDSSLIVRTLGVFPIANCASPAYLEENGVPRELSDLSGHRLIHYVSRLGQRPPGFEYLEGKECRYVPMQGVLTVNSVEAYEEGCLAGLGIIQGPRIGLTELIEQGRLIEVLPQYRAEPMPVSLLYGQRRNLSARVQVFMDWLKDVMVPYLDLA